MRVCLLRPSDDAWIEGECILGKCHNISQGGLGLLVPKSINPHTYIRVYLKGAGTLENRVMEGKTVRSRTYKDGMHEIGIKFCKPGIEQAASQQAAANRGSGSAPKPAATSVATPLVVSGATVTTSVAGSMVRAASSS